MIGFLLGNSLVLLISASNESAADDTIARTQRCVIQYCQFTPVLSYDDAAPHEWRSSVAKYFKKYVPPSLKQT